MSSANLKNKSVDLTLNEDGLWEGEPPEFAVMLNESLSEFMPGHYGPADGDPIALAAHAAHDWFRQAGIKLKLSLDLDEDEEGVTY